jgi:hypothetical protein
MEFDIYIPEYNMAFEYQGEQHYHEHHYYGSPEKIKKLDKEKKEACAEAGITLIDVPYWWDGQIPSLQATILQHRPDVLATKGAGSPIPNEPPKLRVDLRRKYLPAAMEDWNMNDDPSGWYVSVINPNNVIKVGY